MLLNSNGVLSLLCNLFRGLGKMSKVKMSLFLFMLLWCLLGLLHMLFPDLCCFNHDFSWILIIFDMLEQAVGPSVLMDVKKLGNGLLKWYLTLQGHNLVHHYWYWSLLRFSGIAGLRVLELLAFPRNFNMNAFILIGDAVSLHKT